MGKKSFSVGETIILQTGSHAGESFPVEEVVGDNVIVRINGVRCMFGAAEIQSSVIHEPKPPVKTEPKAPVKTG